MNIFLDTTQNEFVACLFDDNFKIKNKIIKSTTQKVEEIPKFFDSLLINKIININDVKNFYINIGPGSFTGSRIALVYVRTIAQITNANILITNSFKLLWSKNTKMFIYANKNNSFKINIENIEDMSKTELVPKSTQEQLIDYKEILNDFNNVASLFVLKSPLDIKPEYGSMPQIGSVK